MDTISVVRTYWGASMRQWNIANNISAGRALLGVTLPLWSLGGDMMLLGVVICAGVSDWLDGWVARRRKEETPIGGVIDPLADKIFTNLFLAYLVYASASPEMAVLAVLNMLYDADNTYRRRHDIVCAFQGQDSKPTQPVTFLSKFKTAALFGLMIFALVPEWLPLVTVETYTYLCISLVASSWVYNYRNRTSDWLV